MCKCCGVFVDNEGTRHTHTVIARDAEVGEYQLIFFAHQKKWTYLYMSNCQKFSIK